MTATEKKEKQAYKSHDYLQICANCRYLTHDELRDNVPVCLIGLFVVDFIGSCKEWEVQPKDRLTEPPS